MKKLLFVFMAACAMMFTACQSCSEQPEKKDAVVIATDDWNEIIEKSVIAIQTAYPEYSFYEASGNLKMLADSTWGIDRSTFQIAFGKINDNATVLGHIINDTLNLEQIDEPWLEDVHTTPFIGMDLDYAVKAIEAKLGFKFREGTAAVFPQMQRSLLHRRQPAFQYSSGHGCFFPGPQEAARHALFRL